MENTDDNRTTNTHPVRVKRIRTPALPMVRSRRGRTRRFNLLCAQFAREVGHPLSLVAKESVRHASALMVKAEELQAKILDGQDVDVDVAVRLASESRRLIATLKRSAAPAEPTPGPTLREYLEGLRDEAEEIAP
jgi:hypothetical protein